MPACFPFSRIDLPELSGRTIGQVKLWYDRWNVRHVSAGAELLLVAVVLYLILVSIGRVLKYRLGTRLGRVYQLFCLAAAPCLALSYLNPSLAGERELGGLTALLGSGVAVRLLDQYFWHGYLEVRRKANVPKFIRELAAVLVFLTVLLVVLRVGYHWQGEGFQSVLAASGVVSIILGFALQDSLGNIIGGFAIQVGRPFQVGDWLLIDNQAVQAIEINWRSTRFLTTDEVQLDVPNQQLVRGTIVNYSGGGHRHAMRLDIGVESTAAPNRVREVLNHAALTSTGVMKDPAPSVYLKSFGDSIIIYEIRYWIIDHRQLNATADSIRTNVWYALRRQHISMPFPTRTLHLERSHPRHGTAVVMPPDPHEAVCEILRRQGLFNGMDSAQLKMLVARCPVQHYGAGEAIIRQGADGASMFVLITGEAYVSVATAGGDVTRVATLRGGDCFGEMSLLTGATRSANVNATSDCEVLEITKLVFAEAIQRDPTLLTRLSALLANRKMQTGEILQALLDQPTALEAKEQEYREGFLHTLKSFFEL